MRDIKFRGRQIIDNVGTWRYGYFQAIPNEKYASIVGFNEDGNVEAWRVDIETVGQFTGLHDKNGRDIYEGDIYRTISETEYEVRFVNGAFCGGILGSDDSMFAPFLWASQEESEELDIDEWLCENATFLGNIHDLEAL